MNGIGLTDNLSCICCCLSALRLRTIDTVATKRAKKAIATFATSTATAKAVTFSIGNSVEFTLWLFNRSCRQHHRLDSGEQGAALRLGDRAGRVALHRVGDRLDMLRRRAAAAADDV